jgi:hypothetical protein
LEKSSGALKKLVYQSLAILVIPENRLVPVAAIDCAVTGSSFVAQPSGSRMILKNNDSEA